MTEPKVLIETVSKLELKDGDILHIKVGGDLGDDQPPWIPGPDDLDYAGDLWKQATKNAGIDVQVVVSHHLMNAEVVRDARQEAS